MTDTGINPAELDPVEKRRFWQEQIVRQLQSKMSQARYCEQNGLKLHQFTYWKYKDSKKAACADVTFVSVPLTGFRASATAGAGLNLITATGHRIEVCPEFDPATLKQLIAALELP
jgi:hypothetical protein